LVQKLLILVYINQLFDFLVLLTQIQLFQWFIHTFLAILF